MSSEPQIAPPSEQTAADAQPVFDVPDLSWEDSKQLTLIGARMQTGQLTIENMEQHFRDIETVLSKVVVSVPRSYLVRKAPDAIDWSTPSAFQWLKARKMMPLLQALGQAQTAEALSGNSPAL
jgi:hypothetical protein